MNPETTAICTIIANDLAAGDIDLRHLYYQACTSRGDGLYATYRPWDVQDYQQHLDEQYGISHDGLWRLWANGYARDPFIEVAITESLNRIDWQAVRDHFKGVHTHFGQVHGDYHPSNLVTTSGLLRLST